MKRRGLTLTCAAALLAGLATLAGGTFGAFKQSAANPSSNFTAAADWAPPSASRAVVGKAEGGVTGYVRQGGGFYVYAQVADAGNPASGVASVQASEPGYGVVSMSPGSFTAGGLTYNWRNAVQQAIPGSVPEGSYSWTLAMTDNLGQTGTQPFPVVIDNTAPAPSTISTANGASVVGRPEQNDTITFTWNEPVEPNSILAGWTGAAQNIVVRINNSGAGDQLQVFNASNAAALPFGTVNLGGTGYVNANRTYGATGNASRMTQSGNAITIVLGNASGGAVTQVTNTTMTWTPNATLTDRAGNPSAAGPFTETGAADREF